MNFLANFLPGVRDARTPFLTGVLWALIVWLWLGPCTLLHSNKDNDLIERFRALPENFGPIPGAILVSLSIYLAGSILSAIAIRVWNSANSVSASRALHADQRHQKGISEDKASASDHPPLAVILDSSVFGVAKNADEIESWLRSHVRAAVIGGATISSLLKNRILSGPIVDDLEQAVSQADAESDDYWAEVQAEWGHAGPESVQAHFDEGTRVSQINAISSALSKEVLSREFPTHLTRLQLDRETIWNEYDRLRSEHELRISLVPPTFGLAIVAMWQGGVPFALSLIIPFALFVHGSRLGRQAEAKVWSALVTGGIYSNSVKQVDEWNVSTK